MEKSYKMNYSQGLFDPYTLSHGKIVRNDKSNIEETRLKLKQKSVKSFKYINSNFIRDVVKKPDKSDAKPGDNEVCLCERKMKSILCRSCGFVFFGRIRSACSVHPNLIHLMDINCCPKCRASLLKEFVQ